MASSLPSHYRTLVLENVGAGFQVKTVPTPQPTEGSAIVRILAAQVVSYLGEVYDGTRKYSFPTPLVPGSSAIGRIAAVGPDATLLKPGQLVFVDCVKRGRDDPGAIFLSALHEGSTEGSKKLMRGVWRDGAFAEYMKAPLEGCIPLDEKKLCSQGLGYSIPQLMHMSSTLVAYGGLRDIALQPGETVIVAPATGNFGSAGVQVAAAMGARVIAMARNEKALSNLKATVERSVPGACVETVRITGDEAADTASLQAFGQIDAVLDLTPPAAADSTHPKSAIMALGYEGRVSLMGFMNFTSSPTIQWKLVGDNITLKGKLMYTRDDMLQYVRMLERGMLPKGNDYADIKTFKLDDWKEALDTAAEWTGLAKGVVLTP